MLTLKQRVPKNWIAAAHQSARSARLVSPRGGRRPLRLSWMNPAAVKKIDPAKNVTPVATAPAHAA